MLASGRIDDALELLRAEYSDTPGLQLTLAQVSGLLELDRRTSHAILRALVDSRFLEQTTDGRFTLARHRDEMAG